jgi:hypothetical protein
VAENLNAQDKWEFSAQITAYQVPALFIFAASHRLEVGFVTATVPGTGRAIKSQTAVAAVKHCLNYSLTSLDTSGGQSSLSAMDCSSGAA